MNLIDFPHKKWSLWVAAFWGAIGAVIVILSGLFYQMPDWRIGALLISGVTAARWKVTLTPYKLS